MSAKSKGRRYRAAISLVASCLLMALSTTASAVNGAATGTVGQIYTYGDGRVLVTGFAFPDATCSNNGAFYIPGDHPHLERILAVVLTARATGARLSVTATIDNCWYPEIAQTFGNFVRLRDD